MTTRCKVRFARADFKRLNAHLFPGDNDEHGAVLLAGFSQLESRPTFYVREVHLAEEGVDYVEGKIGYRALSPNFIHRVITRARDERLAYLAVHNHGSDLDVGFSSIDYDSHELGYPALLQISRGMPVGALVFGHRSVQADIWLPAGHRLDLDEAVIVGNTIEHLTSSRVRNLKEQSASHDRQIRMFGKFGQARLAKCSVGIIGLGGVGSLVAEYLARLGIGGFLLIDDDRVEESNLSRIVGASLADAAKSVEKVKVAQRLILQSNPNARIETVVSDVAKESVARTLSRCDYLFLAADSMRARLVFNAVIHQYFIPGVQMGSKIRSNENGGLVEVMSANRPVRPGRGCLWCNQLIDTNQLAIEAKTDEERRSQAYGVEEPNPSVITLNAISAAHAVNDFLLDYLQLRGETDELYYEEFRFLIGKRNLVKPRHDVECPECSSDGIRYGRGDTVSLPCIEG